MKYKIVKIVKQNNCNIKKSKKFHQKYFNTIRPIIPPTSFQQEQYLDGVAKDILVLNILEYLLGDLIVACFQCTLQKGIIGDQTRLMAG